MIVLTTSVSEAMKPAPYANVMARLNDQVQETLLYITTITLAGLLFGIQALPQGKRRDQLDSVLNDLLVLFQDRVLPLRYRGSAALRGAGRGGQEWGRGFLTQDSYIAAIAASRCFVVASRNTAAFEAQG
jgi:predicted nucleic acid-binding protein